MPPKKAKAKKEEVVEIPKPHLLPDGQRSYFIGGWSKHQSLTAIGGIVTSDREAQNIFVLPPGTEEVPAAPQAAEGTAEGDEPAPTPKQEDVAVVALRAVNVTGLLPALKAPVVEKKEAAAEGEEGDEGAAAGEEEAGEGEEGEAAAKPKELTLFADRAVTISGDLRFESAPAPEPEAPPPEEKTDESKPAKTTKGKKTAAVKEDPAEVAAREAAAAAAREKAAREKEKGASPSTWPVVEISNLYFTGAVSVKGVHINFTNCHFGGGSGQNQLSVHQYCKVNLKKCSFACPAKAGLYCYPLSVVTVTSCIFAGELLPQNAEELEQIKAAGVKPLPSDVTAIPNNSGLYVDDANVTVTSSTFEELATGIILHDKCEGSSISTSTVRRCGTTGIFCHGTAAGIKDCQVHQCGYYGLRFEGPCKGVVVRNSVSGAPVKVGEGARPLLHTNTLSTKLLDLNEKGTVSLQPRY